MSDRPGALRVERVLPATPDAVFRSWTTPALMAGWLSPTGRAEVTADVRVGGRFSVVMLGDETHIDHEGEYLELEPPRRLVFTWSSAYTGDGPSVVTVQLEPVDAGTRIVLTHEQLPAEHAAAHESGWGAILDRLSESLRSNSAVLR
ncbi:MAG TPA: SRPBCC domain-containing protein [Candidatus Dormibacteraeota bacterium]|nr:SRPBCC domain-containing protein [Candidatus Dormibacteraeota bacterium]